MQRDKTRPLTDFARGQQGDAFSKTCSGKQCNSPDSEAEHLSEIWYYQRAYIHTALRTAVKWKKFYDIDSCLRLRLRACAENQHFYLRLKIWLFERGSASSDSIFTAHAQNWVSPRFADSHHSRIHCNLLRLAAPGDNRLGNFLLFLSFDWLIDL